MSTLAVSAALVWWLVVALQVACIHPFRIHCEQSLSKRRHLVSTRATSSSKVTAADVRVYPTADDVGRALCADFVEQAREAISARGAFYSAVPGGSVLKLLSRLKDAKHELDWSKVHLYYVNHKCVPDDDPSATHSKAKILFLDHLDSCNAVPIQLIGDEGGGHGVAQRYSEHIRHHVLLSAVNGLPVFDYMLLGVGKDGHIGSLYPHREEVLVDDQLVLSVDKKSPASITLSLPVMNNARSIRVVMLGEDKAEAVRVAVNKRVDKTVFPVCGIRNERWLIDSSCANLVCSDVECIYL